MLGLARTIYGKAGGNLVSKMWEQIELVLVKY